MFGLHVRVKGGIAQIRPLTLRTFIDATFHIILRPSLAPRSVVFNAFGGSAAPGAGSMGYLRWGHVGHWRRR